MADQADVSLCMVRRTLADLPRFSLPHGYALRWYEAGGMVHWLAVQRQAERLIRVSEALYRKQFGTDESELAQRQLFLWHGQQVIGTATAWFDADFELGPSGQVHWVAIVPAYQGKGLSKPMLSAVCQRLAALGHERAYLKTSSSRVAAIDLYRRFGFEAYARTQRERTGWDELGVLAG